jgi:hypothetical protein
VIQIASILTIQGEMQPRLQCVLTLGTCSDIVGVEVLAFDDEAECVFATLWRVRCALFRHSMARW